jgi:hypothetical protein
MSCGCKANKDTNTNINKNISIGGILQTITIYTLKLLGFIAFITVLPIINVVIIVFSFKLLLLNQNLDMKGVIKHLANIIKKKEDVEKEDDYIFNELTEDDVILLDVEDISQK